MFAPSRARRLLPAFPAYAPIATDPVFRYLRGDAGPPNEAPSAARYNFMTEADFFIAFSTSAFASFAASIDR